MRNIIHVDMDAFYAAVEEKYDPSLKGRPVIVGGRPETRGVVSTANYEAREYGVRSAMPLREAKKRCPHAAFLTCNFDRYVKESEIIQGIFLKYTPLVEPLSLDEAFLDVTGAKQLFGTAQQIARRIKDEIKRETELTASVGISCNKFLAKLASDLEKPDGFTVIRGAKEIAPLAVGRVWGVGPRMEEELEALGIATIGGLAAADPKLLESRIGGAAETLIALANGVDDREVISDSEAKSIGAETTFQEDIRDITALKKYLFEFSEEVGRRLRRHNMAAKTVSIKVRYDDFRTVTRSRTLTRFFVSDYDIYNTAIELFEKRILPLKRESVRLIGVTVQHLTQHQAKQLLLFEDAEKMDRLADTIDHIRDKFGDDAIRRGEDDHG